MMKVMTEIFMKNQQSTDTTLEWVERSIVVVIDQVDALETRLPLADQANQAKLVEETHEDDYDEVEEEEEEEPFNPPRPPPRQQHRDDQQVHQQLPCPSRRPNCQGMGGHPPHGPNQQHAHGNDDPFAKVKFTIPPFYGLYDAKAYLDWEMTIDNKFSSHLVPEQHHV
jgi:hypothetical protein